MTKSVEIPKTIDDFPSDLLEYLHLIVRYMDQLSKTNTEARGSLETVYATIAQENLVEKDFDTYLKIVAGCIPFLAQKHILRLEHLTYLARCSQVSELEAKKIRTFLDKKNVGSVDSEGYLEFRAILHQYIMNYWKLVEIQLTSDLDSS